jgi:hypothetical protein
LGRRGFSHWRLTQERRKKKEERRKKKEERRKKKEERRKKKKERRKKKAIVLSINSWDLMGRTIAVDQMIGSRVTQAYRGKDYCFLNSQCSLRCVAEPIFYQDWWVV